MKHGESKRKDKNHFPQNNKNPNMRQIINQSPAELTAEQKSFTDVLGSWTGVPTDETYPVQDADDL